MELRSGLVFANGCVLRGDMVTIWTGEDGCHVTGYLDSFADDYVSLTIDSMIITVKADDIAAIAIAGDDGWTLLDRLEEDGE